MLGDLFTFIPNVHRLYINLGISPFSSVESVTNVSPLIHLKDFELYSIHMMWTFEDIAKLLSKMPSLQRLELSVCTGDKRLANRLSL